MVYQTPAKIVKGECRDKWKPHFRFSYTEPHPIFVMTNDSAYEGRNKFI